LGSFAPPHACGSSYARAVAKRTAKIFYSWESDLPNATNRGLIGDALERAAEAVASDVDALVQPVVERDTAGVPGAPDIGETIFRKIEEASAFVCDVSLTNAGAPSGRLTPNPNVLIELGFAARALGWQNIVLVFNTAFGRVEELPFDLRRKRALTYEAREGDPERAPARKALQRKLKEALAAIMAQPEERELTVGDRLKAAISTNSADALALADDYMRMRVAAIGALDPAKPNVRLRLEDVETAIARSVPATLDFAKIAEHIARNGHEPAAVALFRAFEHFVQRYRFPAGKAGSFFDSDFDLFRFVGDEFLTLHIAALLRRDKLEFLPRMLRERLLVRRNEGAKHVSFAELSAPVETLGGRAGPGRPLSAHGELLSRRYKPGAPMAAVCPWEEFCAADYFLFVRSVLGPPEGAEDSWAPFWIPWTEPYLRGMAAPTWLMRGKSMAFAVRLAPALGVADVATLRTRYPEAARAAWKVFGGIPRTVGLHEIEELGSVP
jgi:hypothetical protein